MAFELTMYIPVAGNDGMAFLPTHHTAFEAKILDLFGGFTFTGEHREGAWVDQGVRYNDTLRVYIIGLGSVAEGTKVRELATFAKQHYSQLAIYVRYLGVFEIM